MSKILLSWETPEFFPKERTNDWYWALGIIALAIIVTSILLNNILMAVFLIIATFTIFIYAKKKPEIITIQITDDGVKAGRNLYPYSLLKAFYINDNALIPELLLKSESVLNSIIIIPIPKTDPEKVRSTLTYYLSEEEIREPLSQKLMEYLGF